MLFALAVASLVPAVLGYLLGLRGVEAHSARTHIYPLFCAAVSGSASFLLGLMVHILRCEFPMLTLIRRAFGPSEQPKDKS